MSLQVDSPAIDAGDDCVADVAHCSDNSISQLTTDQRGYARKTGAHVDIGAVESNYVMSVTAGDSQVTGPGTAFGTALTVTITESGNPASGIDVTFTAPSSGASGTFQTTSTNTATATTNASGVATSPTFTANSTVGSYTVTASADALSVSFSLQNLATPTITATTNGTGTQDQACSEQPLTLTANSPGASSFQWYRNDNLISGATASTYSATDADTYTDTKCACRHCCRQHYDE
jgi:hypothetical protein